MNSKSTSSQKVPERPRSGRLQRWQKAPSAEPGRGVPAHLRTAFATAARSLERARVLAIGFIPLARTQTLTGQAQGASELADGTGDWGDTWWGWSG